MRNVFIRSLINSALPVAALLCNISSAFAQNTYSLQEIAPLGTYTNSGLFDLNDRGEALVLLAHDAEVDLGDPFLLRGSELIPFIYDGPLPGGIPRLSVGMINNRSEAVGTLIDNLFNYRQTLAWKNPEEAILIPQSGYYFDEHYVNSLNNKGIVAGYTTYSGPNPYKLGFEFNLRTGVLRRDRRHLIAGINDRGSVLRRDLISDQPGIYHVELVRAGSAVHIAAPAGQKVWFDDVSLNNSDTVFGRTIRTDGSSACMSWSAPTFRPQPVVLLKSFPSDECEIVSMNDANEALIQTFNQSGSSTTSRIFRSNALGVVDLVDLVPELANYENLYAIKINRRGQIGLRGFHKGAARGIILTPTH